MNIDLEDVLTTSHALRSIWAGECDFSDEVECECRWKGGPNDYGLHLLTVLRLEDRVIEDWRRQLGRPALLNARNVGKSWEPQYGPQTMPDVTVIQREEYLNAYRDPKSRRKITKEERKTGVLV